MVVKKNMDFFVLLIYLRPILEFHSSNLLTRRCLLRPPRGSGAEGDIKSDTKEMIDDGTDIVTDKPSPMNR